MDLTQQTISTVSGSGQAITRLEGLIYGILISYEAFVPGTTTITIEELEGAQRRILQVANNNTEVHVVPQIPGVDSSNTALAVYSLIPMTGEQLAITVTNGGTVADAVTVWFWTE